MMHTHEHGLPPIAVQVTEAARLISSPPSTVRNWCATGRLPATKLGKSWLIRLDQLDLATRAENKDMLMAKK